MLCYIMLCCVMLCYAHLESLNWFLILTLNLAWRNPQPYLCQSPDLLCSVLLDISPISKSQAIVVEQSIFAWPPSQLIDTFSVQGLTHARGPGWTGAESICRAGEGSSRWFGGGTIRRSENGTRQPLRKSEGSFGLIKLPGWEGWNEDNRLMAVINLHKVGELRSSCDVHRAAVLLIRRCLAPWS